MIKKFKDGEKRLYAIPPEGTDTSYLTPGKAYEIVNWDYASDNPHQVQDEFDIADDQGITGGCYLPTNCAHLDDGDWKFSETKTGETK